MSGSSMVAHPSHVAGFSHKPDPMEIDNFGGGARAVVDNLDFTPKTEFKWSRDGYYPRGVSAIVVKNSSNGEVESCELDETAFVQKCADAGMHPFQAIFGHGGVKLAQNYDMMQSDTWLLPHALIGPNKKVLESYEHLVYQLQSNSWFEELVPTIELPPNSGFNVYWTRTKFDQFKPRRGPVLAMPSMVTARRTGGEATLERLHGGVEIGHGFLNTAMGVRHFFESLLHLALGFMQALNFDKATAISTTPENYRREAMRDSKIPMTTITEEIRMEVQNWAWLQRDSISRFPRLNAWMDAALVAQQGRGDSVVISKECATLLTKVVDDNIHYYTAGPQGIRSLTGDLRQKMDILGTACYVMESFAFGGGNFVHPLFRISQIAGYVPFYDRSSLVVDGGKYVTEERTRGMIEMPNGDFKDVRIDAAIEHCNAWDPGDKNTVKYPPRDHHSLFNDDEFFGHFLWKKFNAGIGSVSQNMPIKFIGEMAKDGIFGVDSRYTVGNSLWTSQPVAHSGDLANNNLVLALDLMLESSRATLNDPDVTKWLDLVRKSLDQGKLKNGGLLPIGSKDHSYTGDTVPPGLDTYEGLQALGRLATYARIADSTSVYTPEGTPQLVTINRQKLQAAADFTSVWSQAISTISRVLPDCLPLMRTMRDPYNELPYYRSAASLAFDTAMWHGGLRAFLKKTGTGATQSPQIPTEGFISGNFQTDLEREAGETTIKEAFAMWVATMNEKKPDAQDEMIDPYTRKLKGGFNDMVRMLSLNQKGIENAVATAKDDKEFDRAVERLGINYGGVDDDARLNWAQTFIESVRGVPIDPRDVPRGPPGREPLPTTIQIKPGDYYETALRISSAMMESIIQKIRDKQTPDLMPASAKNPKVPMTTEELNDILKSGQLDTYFPPSETFLCLYEQSGLARALEAARDTQYANDLKNPVLIAGFEEQKDHPGNAIYNAMAQLINVTPMTKKTMLQLARSNVRVPLGFLGVRPNRVYGTHKATKVLAKNFGGSVKRKGVVGIQDDAEQHKHLVTADMWTSWYADRPENTVDARNVLIMQYYGGEDLTPITPTDYHPDDDEFGGGSLTFFVVPYDWRETPENLILQGNMFYLAQDYLTSQAEREELCYPTAPFYNDIFKWRFRRDGIRSRLRTGPDTLVEYHEPLPAACRMEPHLIYDKKTGHMSTLHKGNDYWPLESVYPGCGADRRGGVFQSNPNRGLITIVSD